MAASLYHLTTSPSRLHFRHFESRKKVTEMPLLSKAGSVLRQTANRQVKSGLSLSMHQATRCTSSMGGSTFVGDSMDRDTGRSTGLGFIGSSAFQSLGGQELYGHHIRMNFATDRPRSFGGCYGHGLDAGFGLRSYGGGAGDKVLPTAAGVGTTVSSTISTAEKISVGQRKSFASGSTASAGGAYEISYTRSGASTANEAGISPNTLRPLSPHLPVYKPQTNSTFSILDRISASYLTGLFVVYYLVCLKMGPICFTFEPFYKFLYYSLNLVPLSLELAAVALAYHTYHGILQLWAIRGSRFFRSRK